MLSFKDFEAAIKYLKKEDEFYCKQYRLYNDYRDIIGDSLPVMYTGPAEIIINLLNNIFYLGDDDTLNWWVYDTNYGEQFKKGDLVRQDLPETHPFREPNLVNTEKLYEYLLFCYNERETERLIKEIEEND